MAIVTLKQKGYGQVEVNSVSGGQITRSKASLPLDVTDFSSAASPCEQGMLLVYDEAKGVVKKPTALTDNVCLHYSEYKFYDDRRNNGLKDFCLLAQDAAKISIAGAVLKADGTKVGPTTVTGEGENKKEEISSTLVTIYSDNDPYPRMFPLLIGDTWTTNTVIYDDTTYADFDAIKTAVSGAGVWASVAVGNTDKALDGYIKLSSTKPTAKVVLKAIKAYDLPDGQPAIKFEVFAN